MGWTEEQEEEVMNKIREVISRKDAAKKEITTPAPACSFCGERGHTFSSCPMPRTRTEPIERLPSRGAVALKVLSAWLSNPEVFWDDGEDSPDADYYTRMAQHAYMAADAFLAQSAPGVTAEVPRKECVCDGFGCAMCTPSIAKKVEDMMAEKRREESLPIVAAPPSRWCPIHQTLDWCHDSGTIGPSGQKTPGAQRARRENK